MDNRSINRYSPPIPAEAGAGEIVSLPASVRRKLELAGELVEQGKNYEANTTLLQAESELARTSPEMLVLFHALREGIRRIEFIEVVTDTTEVRTPRRVLGVRLADHVVTTTNTRATRREIRLGEASR